MAALLLLAALRLLAGLAPVLLADWLRSGGARRVDAASSLALCVGGGVLLASCLLHMLPELRAGVVTLGLQTEFPLAELLVCCGFFLVYAVEEGVQSFTRPAGLRSLEAERRIGGKVSPLPTDMNGFGLTARERRGESRHALVVAALFLHAALEGLALGLAPTARIVWTLCVGVGAHAVAVLFGVGLDLVAAGASGGRMTALMSVLALGTPLGGGVGLLATLQGTATPTAAVVALQGVATGAVLYVTFFEVLDKEKRKGGFLRLGCVLIGFATMTSFQLLSAHNHIHGESVSRKEDEA